MISIKIDKSIISDNNIDADSFAKGCVQAFAEFNNLNPNDAVAVAFKEDIKSKSALVVFGKSTIEPIKELPSDNQMQIDNG